MARTEAPWPPPFGRLLVARAPGETRILVERGGRPWTLALARDHRPDPTGAVYRARVARVEPGLDMAFVDLGPGGQAALPLDSRTLHEGQRLLVQIVRPATADKLARVQRRIALEGRLVVLTPGRGGIAVSRRFRGPRPARDRLQGALLNVALPDGVGALVRAGAAEADPDALAAEATTLAARWRAVAGETTALRDRPPGPVIAAPDALRRALLDLPPVPAGTVVVDDPLLLPAVEAGLRDLPGLADLGTEVVPAGALDDEIDQAVEAALEARVDVTAGPDGDSHAATLWIERTRACLTVDVDVPPSGGREAGRARVGANRLAARGIARHIRLRNESGLAVVDFARMDREDDRRDVARRLAAGFVDDAARVDMDDAVGRLGVLAFSRERRAPSLAEIVLDGRGRPTPETTALAALRRLDRAARAGRLPPRVALATGGDVADTLAEPLAPARADVEDLLGAALEVRETPGAAPGWFEIT